MPRRKLEKSHPWQLHPPPAKNVPDQKRQLLATSFEGELRNSEERTLTHKEATALERTLTHKEATVNVAGSIFHEVRSGDANCCSQHLPSGDKDARQNRSLEALFQAADSELQNFDSGGARRSISTELTIGDSTIQVPKPVHLNPTLCAKPNLTTLSIPSSFPVLKLNFGAEAKPRSLDLQSGSSREVVCIRVDNSLNCGLSGEVFPKTQLQTVSVVPEEAAYKSKPSKPGKFLCKPGKYICQYCSRSCAKPSVLQKHLRTHTGERPYPCNECGFRFKTKSNLYKHCKSRVHLTKLDPIGLASTSLSSSEVCDDQSQEAEIPENFPAVSSSVSKPVDGIELRESEAEGQKFSLGLHSVSCGSQLSEDPEACLQTVIETPRSVTVPELNEAERAASMHSLLRLSDGSMYLMEKLNDGHAMLRPVLQEVAPVSVSENKVSTFLPGKAYEPSPGTKPGISSIKSVLGATNSVKEAVFPNSASGIKGRQVMLLAEGSTVSQPRVPQKSLAAVANVATSLSASSVGLNSLLRLADGSIYVMEKLINGQTSLRPVLQEVAIPASTSVVSPPSPLNSCNLTMTTKDVAIPVKPVVGTSSGVLKEQRMSVSEKLTIQVENRQLMPTPHRNAVRHSKVLQKSSSANVATMIACANFTSHRSLSMPGAHTVSIAPKMAPIDPKNATPQAVQERIAMLISQNASIIDTPMADAPRPKRVLRHNSESVTSASVKPDETSLALCLKPLQRAKSLTPIATMASNILSGNPAEYAANSIASSQPAIKKRKVDSLGYTDSSSSPNSKFLLVPSDPNLKDLGIPRQSLVGQLTGYESLNPASFPKPLVPVKAKSLDTSMQLDREIVIPNSSVSFVMKTLEEYPAVTKATMLSGNGQNPSMWKQLSGSHDVRMVFHLTSSVAQETPNPVTMLHGSASVTEEVRPIAKDVSEKRQEFARTHQVLDSGVRMQGPRNQSTPSLKSVEPQLPVDVSMKLAPALSVQYLVIPANVNQSQTILPVVAQSLLPFAPQVNMAFESMPQNQTSPPYVVDSPVPVRGHPQKLSKTKRNEKTASTLSNASGCSTFHSIPSICITPAEEVPTTEAPDSLWKMKLKGRLLMKRSLSIERTLSEERENIQNKPPDAGKVPAPATGSLQLSDSDVIVPLESGLLRSRSCDAAMPLKKRRKTLTELGRGTAFGTRVEDAVEAAHAVSTSGSDEAKSKQLHFLVEISKTIPDPICGDPVSVLRHSGSVEKSVPAVESRPFPLEMNNTRSNGFPSPLSTLKKTPTNQGSERHCMSSAMYSGTVAKKVPDVISIPLEIADMIPCLVPGRGNIPPLLPVLSGTVTQQLQILQELGNSQCTTESDKMATVSPARVSTLDATQVHQSHPETQNTESVCRTSTDARLKDPGQQNEMVVVQSSSTSALLLLGHLYPSLNPFTNPTFCSIVKPQPMYLPQDVNKKLSMYSTWEVAPPVSSSATSDVSVPNKLAMCQMNRTDSLHHYAMSNISEPKSGVLTHSSYWNFKRVLEMKSKSQESLEITDNTSLPEEKGCLTSNAENITESPSESSLPSDIGSPVRVTTVLHNIPKLIDMSSTAAALRETKKVQIFPGGYKSNEEYVYIRGRGKGKYVCEACGIRCKKPSMLKKHLRTHTDIRPHHCDVCSFGFKTKGNLSKHIKSKAHHLKCSDLGVAPAQPFSVTSDEASVDSQAHFSNDAANSGSLDMNITSSSGDLLEEEEEEEEEEEDVENDEEDDEEDKDDNDEGEDEEDAIVDQSDGFIPTSAAETLSATGDDIVSSRNHYRCCGDGSFSNQVDALRATTDSEAAASLLDLSKGNQADSISMPTNNGGYSDVSNASVVAVPPASLNPALSSFIFSKTHNQNNVGNQEIRSLSIPLKTAGFIPPVLLLTSYASSSFHQPGPVFIAISSASMTPSIPSSSNHPWVILNPSTLVQKMPKCSVSLALPEQEHRSVGEVPVAASISNISSSTASTVFPSICSPVDPPFSSVEAVKMGGNCKSLCEIVPVPGKISGNVEDCVNGKYICGVCRKTFGKQHQLALHRNIHYLERPFRCSDCGISFQNRTLLERHQRSEKHACKTDDPRPFKCDQCGVAFRIHGHLAKHLRSKVHVMKCETHGRIPVEGCFEEKDSEEAEPEVSLLQSEATKTDNKGDGAVEMENASESAEMYRRITHSVEPLLLATAVVTASSSPICLTPEVNFLASLRNNISFPELTNQRRKSEEGPLPVPIRCEICLKTFQDSLLFEKHMNSHAELRPYICEFCDAGFTNARLLESHMATHNQTKEHVCMCGMLSGKSPPTSEGHFLSSGHCNLPKSDSVLMLPTSDGSLPRIASSSAMVMCPVRILPEISRSEQPPRIADGKSCPAIGQYAVTGHAGSLLKVISAQNLLSLANSNVVLMKPFNTATSLDGSRDTYTLGLGTLNVSTGLLINSVDGTFKNSTVNNHPLGILVKTPRATVEDSELCGTDKLGTFHDSLQQSSVQMDSTEPVCQLLAVSFQIGDNIFSEPTVCCDNEKSAFIAPNVSELVHSRVTIITSASNTALPENLFKSIGQSAGL